jgi:hypothetical protein
VSTERREVSAPPATPTAELSPAELARVRDLLDRPAGTPAKEVARFGMDHHLSRIPDPKGAQPGTFEYDCLMTQERKAREAAADREAEEARLRAEREAAEAERQRQWEAHAPQRERALRDLEGLQPRIAEAESACWGLRMQRTKLREIAQMYTRPIGE